MQTVSSTPLQVLVFGAGAIGTYIGGSLVLTGQRVVFLERPELVAPLQQSGLRLQMAGQEFYVPSPVVVADIHQALAQGPLDVAIFALKSFDTRLALENLRSVAAGLPPFLCLQNGVENEMALASLLGDERVIAGTVTSAVGRRGLGSIVLERLRGVGLAAAHPLAGRLAANFNQAGLNAGLYPDAAAMK